MRILYAFLAAAFCLAMTAKNVSAEEGRKDPVIDPLAGASGDPHREFLTKAIMSQALATKSCFACHAAPQPAEAEGGKEFEAQGDKKKQLLPIGPHFLAKFKVETAQGRVIASPQIVLKPGKDATLDFQEEKIYYNLRIAGRNAKHNEQHQVELSVVAADGDGSINQLANVRMLVSQAKECHAEVNGYKFTVTIDAVK